MTEHDYDPTSEYFQHFVSSNGCRAFIRTEQPSRGVWEKFACACGGVWAVKLDRPSSQGGHPINGAIPWPDCPSKKAWPTGRSW